MGFIRLATARRSQWCRPFAPFLQFAISFGFDTCDWRSESVRIVFVTASTVGWCRAFLCKTDLNVTRKQIG